MCIDEFQSLPKREVACADMLLEPRVNVDELTRTVEEPEESIVAVFFLSASFLGHSFLGVQEGLLLRLWVEEWRMLGSRRDAS